MGVWMMRRRTGDALRLELEGRHFPGHMREDPYGKRFPRNGLVIGAVTLAAGALYAWGFCGLPTPGAATAALLDQLMPRVRMPLTGLAWGLLARLAEKIPVSTVTARMVFLSGLFGALAAGLMAALMLRLGYMVRNEVPESALEREAQGRKLSALAAGLFLAVSPPVWLAATRSLPATFHLLLALGGAWVLSECQRKGGRWRFGLASFYWTAMAVECPGTVAFWPVAVCFWVRETFRWRLIRSVGTWAAAAAGAAAGAGVWWAAAWRVWRWGTATPGGVYDNAGAAFLAMAKAGAADWLVLRFSPAVLVFASILLIPPAVLFLLSRRCPWFYERGEILIRALLGAGAAGMAWNAVYSPMFLTGGMQDPALLPYALLAVCFGYVAGEFWIMGQQGLGLEAKVPWQLRKALASAFAVALTVAVAAAPVHTQRVVRLPRGHWSLRLAEETLARGKDRMAVVAAPPLDDLFLLSIREHNLSHFLFSGSRAGDKAYLGWLGRLLPASNPAKAPLKGGAYRAALQAWLENDGLLGVTILADHPILYREYAWLTPVGAGYRMWAAEGKADPARAAEAEEPFWRTVAEDPVRLPPEHPHAPYLMRFRKGAARAANDTGVALAERGNLGKAEEMFRLALQIEEDNLSARMNLLRVCEKRHPGEAETEGMRAAWERDSWGFGGKKWGLDPRYGLVWEADGWMLEGAVWALSGKPLSPPGARRRSARAEEVRDAAYERWIDWAFLVRGNPDLTERNYRERLIGNPWDEESVLALCRLALKEQRWEIAEAYLRELETMGRSGKSVLFEWTMKDYLQLAQAGVWKHPAVPTAGTGAPGGKKKLWLHDKERWRTEEGRLRDPRDVFRRLSWEVSGDMRVWMTLYLMGGAGGDYGEERIERILTEQRPNDPTLWLTLADIHATRGEWTKARKEIRRAMELDVARVALWELALSMAEHYVNGELFQAAQKQLARLQPEHPIVYQSLGNDLYAQGDLQGAIRTFREGVFQKRDPVLLNNLAFALNEESEENYEDALSLVNEAIGRNPGQTRFLDTRAAIHQSHGDYQEALKDVMELIRREPTRANHLAAAEICRKAGWKDQALRVLDGMSELPGRHTPQEQERERVLRAWAEGGE
jgi:tetratricopeptide (TPR) repeat protein